jgi:Protein of unknown function (DUF1592)
MDQIPGFGWIPFNVVQLLWQLRVACDPILCNVWFDQLPRSASNGRIMRVIRYVAVPLPESWFGHVVRWIGKECREALPIERQACHTFKPADFHKCRQHIGKMDSFGSFGRFQLRLPIHEKRNAVVRTMAGDAASLIPKRMLCIANPLGFVPDTFFPKAPGPIKELPSLLKSFESLENAMRTETRMFVSDAIRANHTVEVFIDSNYTFANAALARLYNIEGVTVSTF